MQKEIGNKVSVLIEGYSKKSDLHWAGRSDNNKMVVFPKKQGQQKGDICRAPAAEPRTVRKPDSAFDFQKRASAFCHLEAVSLSG